MYTAQMYVDSTSDSRLAQQQLAPLIRCPQLSLYWLSAAVLSEPRVGKRNLLQLYSKQLKQLLSIRLMMQQANPSGMDAAKGLITGVPGTPASWRLQPRAHKQVRSVQLQWAVKVEDIRAASQRSTGQMSAVQLVSNCMSPPLGGVSFKLVVVCRWAHGDPSTPEKGRSSRVKVGVAPCNVLQGLWPPAVWRAHRCHWGYDLLDTYLSQPLP